MAQPTIRVSNISIIEGNEEFSPVFLKVSLSAPSSQRITVDYATQPVSAEESIDYLPISGTLIFRPGQKQQVIALSIKSDLIAEVTEKFSVVLSNPQGASLKNPVVSIVIRDDDRRVVETNLPPIAQNDVFSSFFSESDFSDFYTRPISDLLINDQDPENHPLKITQIQSGSENIILSGDHLILKTTESGVFSGTYTLSDGRGGTDMGNIFWTVGLPSGDWLEPPKSWVPNGVDAQSSEEPDAIQLSAQNDRFDGLGNDDTIVGYGGDNYLVGGAGDDQIETETGKDSLMGGAGNDTLKGGGGRDILHGGPGADHLISGDGEAIFYLDDPGDVLETNGTDLVALVISNNAVPETLPDYCRALFFEGETPGNIKISDDTPRWLIGADFADTLGGGTGNDSLLGGSGADILSGGSGSDLFYYDALDDSTPENPDFITDFDSTDTLLLRTAGLLPVGISLHPQGTGAFTGTPGDLRLSHDYSAATTLLQLDVNGDKQADWAVKISGLSYDLDKNVLSSGIYFSPEKILSDQASDARFVSSADLDGDGDIDLFSASNVDDKLAWYQNQGQGIFSAQKVISTATDGPQEVIAVDLNADGRLDLASVSIYDDKLAWYQNKGNGIFSAQKIISQQANGARGLTTADLDRDGDMDLLTASIDDDKIAWYQNQGAGIFSEQKIISQQADEARVVAVGDLDNDGDLDVVSGAGGDDTIAWYENLGQNKFSDQKIIFSGTDLFDVIVADLDNDQRLDIASISWYDSNISWYKNLGEGRFSGQIIISTSLVSGVQILAEDLDKDGDLDLISTSYNDDQLAYYTNLGQGNFAPKQVISDQANGARGVTLADLDSDGDLDVASASSVDNEIAWYSSGLVDLTPRRDILFSDWMGIF